MKRIAVITQRLDPNDYVFGFFYGHIIDLARVANHVHVICLEKGQGIEMPQNVTVHTLGKEEGVGRWGYLTRLFNFLFHHSGEYDTVLVHMEPLYIVLCGWWWRLTGKRVILWYNHVFYDMRLKIAAFFVHEIVGVSAAGIPVPHKHVRMVSYEHDLTNIITGQ